MRELPAGELFKQLSQQTTTLVQQGARAGQGGAGARRARRQASGPGMFGAAGLFGVIAFAALTACLVAVLDTGRATCGLAALDRGRRLRGRRRASWPWRAYRKVKAATPPMPEQTIESSKEDVQWAKNQRNPARHRAHARRDVRHRRGPRLQDRREVPRADKVIGARKDRVVGARHPDGDRGQAGREEGRERGAGEPARDWRSAPWPSASWPACSCPPPRSRTRRSARWPTGEGEGEETGEEAVERGKQVAQEAAGGRRRPSRRAASSTRRSCASSAADKAEETRTAAPQA